MKRRITAIALVLVMVLSTVSFPAELGEGLTEELTADAVLAEDDIVIGEEDPEEFVFEDTGDVDEGIVFSFDEKSGLLDESDADPDSDILLVVDEPQPVPEETTETETEAETDLVSMLFSEEAAEPEPDQGLVLSAVIGAKRIQTEDGTDDTDYLFEKFVERELYGTVKGSVTPSAKAPKLLAAPRLTGVDLLAYNVLKAQIVDAAAGRRSSTEFTISLDDLGLAGENWTAEELGVETLIVDGSISGEAASAVYAKLYDLNKVVSALLNTLPFDLYWYDKTQGVQDSGAGITCRYNNGKNDDVLSFDGDITLSFAVASEYALSTYEVNTQIGTAVEAAGNKAAEIVANYASAADYEKLLGYKNEICSLVSYNYSAVSTPTDYGNPWQLIWVFDGDPATDVVCEGYSKAFKYLCDLTSFSSSLISCITVTGTMSGGTGAGAHMWDVVHMGNGKNYLVDVTNCDAGSIGADDLLFLAGYSNGNIENGYIFSCGSEYITFKYDNKTTGYYGEEDLVLSSSAYTAHDHTPAQERTGVKAATCTEPGYTGDLLCTVCGEVIESGTVVPATGHQHTTVQNAREVTCTEDGYTGDTYCSDCGALITEGTIIPASGHTWLPGEIISEATCTEAGEEEHVCSICGLTETVTIPALGHQHTEIRDTKEATCTAEGYSGDIYCSDCGQLVSGGHSIAKLAHTWDEGVIEREPDADADGLKVYTCSVCGERKEEVIKYQAPLQDLSDAAVTVSAQTYTGKALTPAPVVKLDGTALVKGTDYTVGAYSDNINVGTGKVTITGIGRYTGTATAEFKINPAAQSITVKSSAASVAVGKTATVSISGAKGKITYKSSNTAIADVNTSGKVTAKKVGTVTITAASAATANYKPASKTVTIKVVLAATGSLKAANLATGIKLTWAKVAGATGYKVYRNGTLIKTITSGSTVTYTDAKANTNGTKYTFKIVATASTGASPLSRSVTTYRVAKPAISSAANTAAGKMTVKWKKNAKASGYQIQYSLSKTFASGNKSVTIAKVGTLSKVIGSLKKGKTYYVRMRTFKTVGSTKYYSAWSAKKAVKISK